MDRESADEQPLWKKAPRLTPAQAAQWRAETLAALERLAPGFLQSPYGPSGATNSPVLEYDAEERLRLDLEAVKGIYPEPSDD